MTLTTASWEEEKEEVTWQFSLNPPATPARSARTFSWVGTRLPSCLPHPGQHHGRTFLLIRTVTQRWRYSQHIFMMMSRISHSWGGGETLP